MTKFQRALSLVALTAVSAGAVAGDRCPTAPLTPLTGKTIVDVAAGNANFSTLVSLLTSANLVSTLQGPGPFTVFAPTNDAFAQIPAPVLGAIGSDPALLNAVLTYHVAAGKALDLRRSDDIKGVTTVQGQSVFSRAKCSKGTLTVTINNSQVVMSPIAVDNGIIYVIDKVLVPQF